MAKAKKVRKLTTEEALQALLGRKAAKRIRQVAQRLLNEQADDKKSTRAKKKR
jgi:hypothetical protein